MSIIVSLLKLLTIQYNRVNSNVRVEDKFKDFHRVINNISPKVYEFIADNIGRLPLKRYLRMLNVKYLTTTPFQHNAKNIYKTMCKVIEIHKRKIKI